VAAHNLAIGRLIGAALLLSLACSTFGKPFGEGGADAPGAQPAATTGSLEAEATSTHPEDVPDPLVVTVHLEENSFEFPTPDPQDPSTWDPSQYFPPGFDPENPDYTLLAGPRTVYATIGPEGGTVEATGANGARYTLVVPPRAVEVTLAIGLTPVASIDGLPLSGGLIAAVNVEPEAVEFDPPLRLEISLPDEAPPPSAGQLVMGFAVTPMNEGSEFYFVPRVGPSTSAQLPHGGGQMFRPVAVGPLGNIVIRDGGVYGTASGTPAEVRSVAKRRPSSSSHRTTSAVAEQQMEEELAPLPDKAADRIREKAAAAGTTDEYLAVVTDLQAYLDAGGKNAEGIWDEVLLNTKVMFEKTKGKCLTRDGTIAAGVAGRMTFADEGTFWSEFRDRYVKKYGEQSLDEARKYAERCKLKLTIESTVTWKSPSDVTITYVSTTQVAPLLMRYRGGPVLMGCGLVIPSRVDTRIGGCAETILNPEPNEYLWIEIAPTFGGDELLNFKIVNFGGGGLSWSLTQRCDPRDARRQPALGAALAEYGGACSSTPDVGTFCSPFLLSRRLRPRAR
jgi:hypothetical protein